MRLSTIAIVLAVFGAAAGGAYVSARAAAGWIETTTVDAVENRLKVDGHNWATVSADGLRVTLDGEAPSEAERFKVLSSVGSVVDASRVYDNFTVAELGGLEAPDFSIEILRNDAGISLIGLIPAQTSQEEILQQINARVPGVGVSDFLETADYPVPANWDASVDYGITALGILERTKITIKEELVSVEAITQSEEEKKRLETNLSRRLPEGVKGEFALNAPLPVITPFILRFQITDGTARMDACSAESEESAAKILKAAAEAGLDGKSECRIGLGVPSPDWADAASSGMAAIAELGGGKLTISDVDMGLIAVPGSDPAKFEATTTKLTEGLPPAFALNASLPELRSADDAKPEEFTATRSPEGQLQLRGAMLDDQTKGIMETFARAKFGTQGISESVEINPDLPSGWTVRVLAGLEVLGELNSGLVTVTPSSIDVRGRSGNQNIGALVSQSLIKRLGSETDFDLDLTYDAILDPVANRLKPADCVQEITKVAETKKITFEPGSTNLDGSSRAVVDQIAAIMARCPDAEIEISGHTDSQGREEMNLSLSQDRANAVLGALTLKRVEMKTLVAQGYGETQPIADNGTEAGREANRRIEFRLITPVPVPLDGEDSPAEEN